VIIIGGLWAPPFLIIGGGTQKGRKLCPFNIIRAWGGALVTPDPGGTPGWVWALFSPTFGGGSKGVPRRKARFYPQVLLGGTSTIRGHLRGVHISRGSGKPPRSFSYKHGRVFYGGADGGGGLSQFHPGTPGRLLLGAFLQRRIKPPGYSRLFFASRGASYFNRGLKPILAGSLEKLSGLVTRGLSIHGWAWRHILDRGSTKTGSPQRKTWRRCRLSTTRFVY